MMEDLSQLPGDARLTVNTEAKCLLLKHAFFEFATPHPKL